MALFRLIPGSRLRGELLVLPNVGELGSSSFFGSHYSLSAGTGAVALVGNAANVLANLDLLTAAGSFSLTGNAAILTFASGDTLAVDAGAFVLSGQGVTFARSIVASSGAFALTGQDADLDGPPTDADLAAEIGVTELAISSYKRNIAHWTLEGDRTYDKIGAYFNVDPMLLRANHVLAKAKSTSSRRHGETSPSSFGGAFPTIRGS